VNLLHSIDALDDLPGPVHLAIGVFDGVHLGHQAVIRSALAQPGTGVVVTFDPHPSRVLRPDRTPLMLTSTRHKINILRTLDVKNLLVIPFDDAFARTSARDFVRRLQSVCHPLGSVAVGSDWTFGHRAAGNVDLLRSLGVTVHAIDPVIIDGEMARSTLVRDAVKAGDIVKVRVVEIDLPRKRIALTMKVQEPATGPSPSPAAWPKDRTPPVQAQPAKPQTSLAAAFGKLKR